MNVLLCLIISSWLQSPVLVLGQLTWESVRPAKLGTTIPPKRRDAGLGYDRTRNILVLFGGRTSNQVLNDTWVYDLSANVWREVLMSTDPPARFSFVSGFSQGHYYIATGEGRDGTFYNDVWKFDMSTSEWNAMSHLQYSPASRYGAAGGIFPDSSHLYVSLGFSTQRYFDTVTYDTAQRSWQAEFPCYECHPYSPTYPHARCLHSGTMTNDDELVIFGGCLTGGGVGGPCPSGDSWMFEGNGKVWKQLPNCITPSIYSSMALLPITVGERRVVLFGGIEVTSQVIKTSESNYSDVGILNPGTGQWTRRQTEAAPGSTFPSRRASVSMATGDHGIYIFGGTEVDGGGYLNDLWLLRGNSVSADNSKKLECPQHFFNFLMLHGILMTIAWGVFLLWGAFIARYLKQKDPLWFYLHVSMQIFGLCCAIAGFAMSVVSVQFDHFQFAHGIIGLIAMILGIFQPVNAALRPYRPEMVGECKSLARLIWEFIHHSVGRVAVILALVNISLGVFLAIASITIWAIWLAYLSLIVVIFGVAEVYKCRQDRRLYKAEVHMKAKIHELDQNGVCNPNFSTLLDVEISRL